MGETKPTLLPPRRAAIELGLSEFTVRKWLAEGKIQAVYSGKKAFLNVTRLRETLENL